MLTVSLKKTSPGSSSSSSEDEAERLPPSGRLKRLPMVEREEKRDGRERPLPEDVPPLLPADPRVDACFVPATGVERGVDPRTRATLFFARLTFVWSIRLISGRARMAAIDL